MLNAWVLKSQRKKKNYRSCTGIFKCTKNQEVQDSPSYLKYALQNKFLNLSLRSFTPKLKILISKILSSYNKCWVLQNCGPII